MLRLGLQLLLLVPWLVHASPIAELYPAPNQRIVAYSMATNSLCWLETPTPNQLRREKLLEQPSTLTVKALSYHAANQDFIEEVVWESAVVGNMVFNNYQAGADSLTFQYTNTKLIPQKNTVSIQWRGGRWRETSRPPQITSALPTTILTWQDQELKLAAQPTTVRQTLRLDDHGRLEAILAGQLNANQVLFTQSFDTELSMSAQNILTASQPLGQLRATANTSGNLLLFTHQETYWLLSLTGVQDTLRTALEQHIEIQAGRSDLPSQLDAIKHHALLRQFQNLVAWDQTQKNAMEVFAGRIGQRLVNTLLPLIPAAGDYLLLMSPWQNLAYVLPKQIRLQLIANASRLDNINQKTLYTLKARTEPGNPDLNTQRALQQFIITKSMSLPSTTTEFKFGLPQPEKVEIDLLNNEIASLSIRTLADRERLHLLFALESREAKLFEDRLAQGIIMNYRLNTKSLGFETIQTHVIPMQLQLDPAKLQASTIDRDYVIHFEICRDYLQSLWQSASKLLLQVRYQGEMLSIPLTKQDKTYTATYRLARDQENQPIYRFQYRLNRDNESDSWNKEEEQPFAYLSAPIK